MIRGFVLGGTIYIYSNVLLIDIDFFKTIICYWVKFYIFELIFKISYNCRVNFYTIRSDFFIYMFKSNLKTSHTHTLVWSPLIDFVSSSQFNYIIEIRDFFNPTVARQSEINDHI